MRGQLVVEPKEHAADELRHAAMLAERIIQLGGKLLLEPEEWYQQSDCGYEAPSDASTVNVLEQSIKGEQRVIYIYKRLVDITQHKDPATYDLALQILKDEVEHEEELEAAARDIKAMKSTKTEWRSD